MADTFYLSVENPGERFDVRILADELITFVGSKKNAPLTL